MLFFIPRDVLDEILSQFLRVSTYSSMAKRVLDMFNFWTIRSGRQIVFFQFCMTLHDAFHAFKQMKISILKGNNEKLDKT